MMPLLSLNYLRLFSWLIFLWSVKELQPFAIFLAFSNCSINVCLQSCGIHLRIKDSNVVQPLLVPTLKWGQMKALILWSQGQKLLSSFEHFLFEPEIVIISTTVNTSYSSLKLVSSLIWCVIISTTVSTMTWTLISTFTSSSWIATTITFSSSTSFMASCYHSEVLNTKRNTRRRITTYKNTRTRYRVAERERTLTLQRIYPWTWLPKRYLVQIKI